jgi:glucosamine kinase
LLVEDVFAFFNNDIEQFVKWANRANSKEFARLAPLVINHSQQGEIAAVRLMKKAAQAVERVSDALDKMRSAHSSPFPVCLFGGIAPFIESWLSEELRSSLVERHADASMGAIIMVRDKVANDSKAKQPC